MAILAVHRNEPLGLHDGQVGLQFVGLGVTGGVYVGDSRVHHFGAGSQQTVDHAGHVELVARNGVTGKDDGVVFADLQQLAVTSGHQRQRRHGFALTSGGDHAHLVGRVIGGLFDVDEGVVGNLQHPEVPRHADVLLHGTADGGHLASGADGRVDDLLHAVDVTRERRGDDPAVSVLVEQGAQYRTDAGLARRVPVLLRVRRIAQQQAHALVGGDGTDARQVGATSVHGREIQLEVARVQDDPLRRVHGHREGVRNRVRHGDELHVEGSDHATFAVSHHHQIGAPQQSGFLDATTRQTQRDGRAEHGERQLAQQELQRSDVVLVTVRGHATHHAVGVLAQPREVRQHQVDAVHVDVGEHQATVDEEQLVVLLDHHAVATDLTQSSEEDHPHRIRHQLPFDRAAWRFAHTFLARSATKSAGGPMGRRHRPTGTPSMFIITLLGMGFGESSPVS